MEYRLTVVIMQLLFLALDIVILFHAHRNRDVSSQQKIFLSFTSCVVIQQLFALLSQLAYPGLWTPGVIFTYVIYIILFTAMTACSFAWYMYLRYVISGGDHPSKKNIVLCSIPLIVIAVTSLLSPLTHWVLYVDNSGVYQRGSLMILQMLCPYTYVVMGIVLAIVWSKKRNSANVGTMLRFFLLFALPSLICVFIQMKIIQGGYSAIGISLGLIVMYLEIYVEDVNESKRLKSVELLNVQLQQANDRLNVVNEEQNAQLEEITSLNTQLEENQAQLEESAAEQEAQLEEIQSLNVELDKSRKELESQLFVISTTAQRYFCMYTIDIDTHQYHEIFSLPNMHAALGSDGDALKGLEFVWKYMVIPEDQEAMRNFNDVSRWREYLKDGEQHSCEYRGITSGWSRATIFASAFDENGQVKSVVYANEQIHEQKEFEMTLSNQLDEIKALNVKLEEARSIADSANQSKSTFLFNMSHDIRTPMNAILGFTTLMEKKIDNPEVLGVYIKKIKESGEYLLSIINNILDMAKIESGKAEIDEDITDIGDPDSYLFRLFTDELEKKNLTLTHDVRIQHRYVFSDEAKIAQILINIISNAIKYTPAGGHIHHEFVEYPCEREGYGHYVTKISDDGIGMSKDFLTHIFDSFTREHTSTESKVIGTGLGMSIVKKLVDLLGGTIEVESELGKGSTFIFTIDYKLADAPQEIVNDPSLEEHADFSGKRILLAEDNDLNAEIAVELLNELGFEVLRVKDGVSAVDSVIKSPAGYYDLILMDIQMPNMNGYDATITIRKLEDKEKADIPIVAMTANAFEEDKKNAFGVGMNGHLAKPVEIPKLISTLSGVLK